VFIYGGNGSGKTTFVSMLLGLLLPTTGGVYYNNFLIDEQYSQSYSSLFGVVFSDFYLFDEFYGIEQLDSEKLAYYLRLFEIDGKVQIENGRFSTTHLSTGQRKRLALITALLEGKPLLVLDEWAADQDPYFRKKFYTQIIPELKEAGFTIIAITHDDKYYNCASLLYKMEDGKLVRELESVF
jgi:putative ATP-binding cassette transporter